MSDVDQSDDLVQIFKTQYFHHSDNFVQKSNLHGIKQVHQRKICTIKWWFWYILVMGCFVGSAYQSVRLIRKIFSSPSLTDVRIESGPTGFVFPDVTFCDPLSGILHNTIVAKNDKNYMDPESLLKMKDLSDLVVQNVLKGTYNEMSAIKQRTAKSMAYEHFLNLSIMYPRVIDRIIMCKYNGEDCDFSQFIITYHRDYHNCYTFVSSIEPRVGKNFGLFVLFFVPNFNNSEWANNIATIDDLSPASVRVEIMEPNSRSRPLQRGYNCPLSTKTDIEITQSMMDIQKGCYLYETCDPPSIVKYYDLQSTQETYYQKQYRDCIDMQYTEDIYNKCGCYPEGPLVVSSSENKTYSNREYCSYLMDSFLRDETFQRLNSLNETDRISQINAIINNETGFGAAKHIKCLWNYYKTSAERETFNEKSTCKPICTFKFYGKNVIQSPWPEREKFERISSKIQMAQIAEIFQTYFQNLNINTRNLTEQSKYSDIQLIDAFKEMDIVDAQDVLKSCEKDTWNSSKCSKLYDIVNENMAVINIFAATDSSINYNVFLSYEIWDFIGDLGGTFNFWIGLTTITVIEIVELALRLSLVGIKLIILKFRKSKNQRKPQSALKNTPKKKMGVTEMTFSKRVLEARSRVSVDNNMKYV